MDLVPQVSPRPESVSALVVGVGALGCQAAAALAVAGVGKLTLVDDDRVERTNLQRQVLFDTADIGRPKSVAAALALRSDAPTSMILAHVERLTPLNAGDLLSSHDVAIDATDDPDSKYLINRAAREAGRPFVYGGVARTTGLVMAVRPGHTACLACAFPLQLSHGDDSCAVLGILAPVAGVIGALQARLALRLLADPPTAGGTLYVYEARGRRWRMLQFERDPDCSICSPAKQHAA